MFVESADDFAKKYSNTFIKYNDKCIYVKNIEANEEEENNSRILLYYIEPSSGRNKSCDFEPAKIEEIHLNSMMFNDLHGEKEFEKIKDGYIPGSILYRNPRRQWKRSLCTENSYIELPVFELFQLYGRKLPGGWHNSLTLPVIDYLVEPKYTTLHHAWSLIERLKCIAVSPNYCLAISTISDRRALIGSMFGFIGEFHPGDGVIIKHKPAVQEFKDFLQRSGQNYLKVEVCP